MTSINLVPSPLLFARAKARRLRSWGGAAVVAIVLVAIPCALDQVRAAQAASLREQLDALSIEEATFRNQVAEMAKNAEHLESQIERAKALQSKREWSKMLAMLGACLPRQAWYTSIATDPVSPVGGQKRSGAAVAKAKARQPADKAPKTITIDAPRRLVLIGFALEYEQVYELMGHLKETGVFKGIELLKSGVEENRDVSTVRFELVCDW